MEKPLLIKINEFKEKIIEIVNSSELPSYVLKKELESIYSEIERIEQKEIEEYNKKIEEEKSNGNNNI